MRPLNREFVFEDLYCDAQGDFAVLRAVRDSAPLLIIQPATREISSKSVLCFGMGFAQFAHMRRALIEARGTLTAVVQGKLSDHAILAAAAHLDTPLKTLGRIEGWASDYEKGLRHDIRV